MTFIHSTSKRKLPNSQGSKRNERTPQDPPRRFHSQVTLGVLRRCANSSTSLKMALRRFLPWGVLAWYAQHNVYLVSYPKCGRTWLRLLMIQALRRQFGLQRAPQTLELFEVTRDAPELPRILVTHGGYPHLAPPHQIATNARWYQKSNVVLLVRDPRDAIVSLYFHMKHRCDTDLGGTDPGSLPDFILGKQGGIDTLIAFYNQWAMDRSIPKALHVVRYERLHTRPVNELQTLFEFLGVKDMTVESLRYAIDQCSFAKMRRLEERDALRCDKLRPGDVNNIESYKTRRGLVGGFRQYLSSAEIKALEKRINTRLADFFGDYKYCSGAFGRDRG